MDFFATTNITATRSDHAKTAKAILARIHGQYSLDNFNQLHVSPIFSTITMLHFYSTEFDACHNSEGNIGNNAWSVFTQ